jgi:hypothetical protein
MTDSYTELKELSELRGSLNIGVSQAHRGKRPPALSESWAGTPENRERAMTFVQQVPQRLTVEEAIESTEATSPPVESPATESPATPSELPYASQHRLLLSFLFHLALISLFETLFFFFYVSTLENACILKVVAGFEGQLVRSCEQLPPDGRVVVNDVLALLLNATAVEARGAAALTAREAVNGRLLQLAWFYVLCVTAAFAAVAGWGAWRGLRVGWRSIVLENCGLVVSLGVFEGLFFTTIVYPYLPVTGPEIAGSLVANLNATCGV